MNKYYLVENQFAFIGYYIVEDSTIDGALEKVMNKAVEYYQRSIDNPLTWKIKEIVFDADGIFDELSMLE